MITPDLSQILLFLGATLLLNLTPGADVLYIASRSFSQGKRYGVIAAFGISSGIVIYVIITAFGVGEIFQYSPLAFWILKLVEARKAGLPVQVFGRQERHQAELEAAGSLYHILPDPPNQIKFIRPYLKKETIVITAARTPRVKAPLLIDEESLSVLPKGAVIIDLAVNEGGNVVGSKSDQVVIKDGVFLAHVSGYPKAEPKEASEAYANCLARLLAEVLSPRGELNLTHDLLKECWLTHRGKRNLSLFEAHP